MLLTEVRVWRGKVAGDEGAAGLPQAMGRHPQATATGIKSFLIWNNPVGILASFG
jgi:hypothetical protein